MKRRVYHIIVAPAYQDGAADVLYAVADDDTIWTKTVTLGDTIPWRQIESLPDAEPAPIPARPPSQLTTLRGEP